MEWFKENIHPEKEGDYLGCGQAIEWNMKDTDNPDWYFISHWNGESWTHQENYGREFHMQYWTFLPEKPKHNQPERSKREDLDICNKCKIKLWDDRPGFLHCTCI